MERVKKLITLRNLKVLKGQLIINIEKDNNLNLLDERQTEKAFDFFGSDHNVFLNYYHKNDFSESLNFLNSKIRELESLLFKRACHKSWFDLSPTNNNKVKFCLDCNKHVFKVEDFEELNHRRQLQQCVAIDPDKFKKNEEQDFRSCLVEDDEDNFLLGLPG